jgi:hypothetical protein
MRRIARSPTGPLVGRRIKKNLHVCSREDHCTDIAAFHDHATPPAQFSLSCHERCADPWESCRRGRCPVDFRRTDGMRDILAVNPDDTVNGLDEHTFSQPSYGRLIVQRQTFLQRFPRDRPIHRARIDMVIPEVGSNRLGNRSFASA